MELPLAEKTNYWKTGRSAPDTWIEKTMRQIEKLGGRTLVEAFGNEPTTGRAAYMLHFEIAGNQYKVVWPVLPTKSDKQAARIQAATMLYHDIKAKCISAAVLGVRAAFFSFLLLPDGRTAAQVSTPELLQAMPEMFAASQLEARIDPEDEKCALPGVVNDS